MISSTNIVFTTWCVDRRINFDKKTDWLLLLYKFGLWTFLMLLLLFWNDLTQPNSSARGKMIFCVSAELSSENGELPILLWIILSGPLCSGQVPVQFPTLLISTFIYTQIYEAINFNSDKIATKNPGLTIDHYLKLMIRTFKIIIKYESRHSINSRHVSEFFCASFCRWLYAKFIWRQWASCEQATKLFLHQYIQTFQTSFLICNSPQYEFSICFCCL